MPSSDPFFRFVQKMAQSGITAGCAANLYCPNESLTRGQMAVFIVTGLLNELLPAGTPFSLSGVQSGAASAGQTLTVTVTGVNTHFVQGTTQVTAAGITASNITVAGSTSLTVQLMVGAAVPSGPTSLVVTTNTEEAVLPNGFVVQ